MRSSRWSGVSGWLLLLAAIACDALFGDSSAPQAVAANKKGVWLAGNPHEHPAGMPSQAVEVLAEAPGYSPSSFQD